MGRQSAGRDLSAHVVVGQVRGVLEAVHVDVTGVQCGVRLGVSELLELNVDTLLLGVFALVLLENFSEPATDGDLLGCPEGGRGGLANWRPQAARPKTIGDNCECSSKLLHGSWNLSVE